VNLLETRSDEATAVAGRLGLELDAVLARTRASAPQALDADTLARLQALGYALPAGPVPERRADEAPVDPKDGRRAMKWLVAANAAYHEDRPDALELLERTVREMPRSSRAHALLGFQHLHSGDAARARTHLEEAVRLNPLSGYYRAMLGETKRALGDADGALADYRAAAALDPDEPYAWVGLMWHAARRGDFATAERNAGQAAAVAAANAVVRVRIGEVWETFGQYGQAGAAFESAVRIDPALEYAQMRLAVVLARFGRVADSDRHRERAGALARDPWLQSRLALAHAASGDAERAESLLGELLEREPGYEPAKRALARVRHRREERGEGTTEAGPS
jgi:tetratricopeptide (TPR) repeat protein